MLISRPFYIWQQSICWSFIIISGFCFLLGKHHLKRNLLCLGGGILISCVTSLLLPEERDLFGVLWMLGCSGLLMILWDKIYKKYFPSQKSSALVGLIISLFLFVLFRNVNSGYLGFEGFNFAELPQGLYKGYFMTFLGFMDPSFYSSDYFSLIPWVFLYFAGYYIKLLTANTEFENVVLKKSVPGFEFVGKHSLIIYMCHQVVIFGLFYICSIVIGQ